MTLKGWQIFAEAAGINWWLCLGLGFVAFAFVDNAKRPLGLTGKAVFWLTLATAISLSLMIVFLRILDTDLQVTLRIGVRGVLRSIITAVVALAIAGIRRRLPDKRKGKAAATEQETETNESSEQSH